ncbi:XTP/dITP diphosphatase [Dethiothermospora halolimnae]|uniref:XTP/dITP diphosphatase n=1 Tax=Dethiothermospora halolimnae TaxID=3114390 RepID=UPI003CCC401D
MSKDIIVSSGNKHKIDEITKILKDLPVNILSKDDVGLEDFDVVEDKDTLEGNALKKATEMWEHVDGIVIADDSGLFVDSLKGDPGIYSARYAGENAKDKDNNKKLLNELDGVELEDRTASFKTAIAIVLENGETKTLIGECSGRIGFTPKGSSGFGYDPLFIVDGYNKTFAELGEETKNKISHRANALKKLRTYLEDIIKD